LPWPCDRRRARNYDRHAYYDEKKAAFEALAAQIDRIINPQDNVLPMRNEVLT
jgi:hypothetical protein